MFHDFARKRCFSALGKLKTCVFAMATLTFHSAANAGSDPPRVILNWQGPVECNISSAVDAHVNRLLKESKRVSPPLTVALSVVRVASRYRLVLETTGDLRRELEAKTCEELTKPAGVIIALAIDAEAANRAIDAAKDKEGARGPRTGDSATPEKPAAVPAFDSIKPNSTEPSPLEAPPSTTPRRAEPTPPPRSAEPSEGPARLPGAPLRDTMAPHKSRRMAFAPYLRGATIADFGALPKPGVGP